MPRSKKIISSTNTMDHFLRSINITLDANDPSRVAHYRPTNKSLGLLRLLLGEESNSLMIAAPYGVGKSITSTVALHLVENQKRHKLELKPIVERVKSLSKQDTKLIMARRRLQKHGLVLALQGHSDSVPIAIKDAMIDGLKRIGSKKLAAAVKRKNANSMDDLLSLFQWLSKNADSANIDRVLIVWDEFGRHLEYLVNKGRATELLDIQQLAEFVSRQQELPMNFVVLLHQGLLSYSMNLPDAAKREWGKIEGRFEPIGFYDDSFEPIRFSADLIASRQPDDIVTPSLKVVKGWAKAIKKVGLFNDASETKLTEVARSASSISLPALWVLPRISSRIAQNERTIFTFIESVKFGKRVYVEDLYEHFATSMRLDTGPGGTYRRYIETESAIAKCETDLERQIIRTCAILSLSLAQSQNALSLDLLETVLEVELGIGKDVMSTIESLINKKLLLHRRHNDEVSVWHGTDVDLRSRQEEIKDSHRPGFDLCEFLSSECAPPVWRPIQFNDTHQMRRFYRSSYALASDLELQSELFSNVPPGEDGSIIYVIPENTEELNKSKKAASNTTEQIIFAIPNSPIAINEAALEVFAIIRLQEDGVLTSSDPLIMDELRIMEDDARGYLQSLINLLIEPSDTVEWFNGDESNTFSSQCEFRSWLSKITDEVFSKTPRINNEIVNRNKPSAPVVNARKKLVEGILESDGTASFGLTERKEIGAAVIGLARALLEKTNLYSKNGSGWQFSKPSQLPDVGLQAVWARLELFMTVPSKNPKSFQSLINELQSPPYGVRAGVLPILIAAAFRAFPVSTVLLCDDIYVEDLTPTVVETICRDPNRFRLRVIKATKKQIAYLSGVLEMFGKDAAYQIDEKDLLRGCAEAIASWREHLSVASKSSHRLSKRVMLVRKLLSMQDDPAQVLLEAIPSALKCSRKDLGKCLATLQETKHEIEHGVLAHYFKASIGSAKQAMVFGGGLKRGSLRKIANAWACSIPGSIVRTLESKTAIAAIEAARRNYDSDELFINGLAVSVYGRPISRWIDEDVYGFAVALRAAVRDIEDGVLASVVSGESNEEHAVVITEFLQFRASHLLKLLKNHAGVKAVDEVVGKTRKVKRGS